MMVGSRYEQRKLIFEAIEAALETATKKKALEDIDVKVEINRKTGDYATYRRWLVVDDVVANSMDDSDDALYDGGLTALLLSEAKKRDPKIKASEYILEPIESVEFGRIAAQKAKQVIIQKVLEAERAQIINAYKEKIGTLINGTVKKVIRDFIAIDIGANAEAILLRSEMIPHEAFRTGDRVRSYLYDIHSDGTKAPQIDRKS